MQETNGNFAILPLSFQLTGNKLHSSMMYCANFFLRKEKAKEDGTSPIYLRITYNGQRAELSLNTYINPDLWEQQKLRGTGKESKNINETLQILKHRLRSIYNELKEKNFHITAALLKARLSGDNSPDESKTERKRTVLDAINYHIQEVTVQANKGTYSEATVKKYQYLSNHLSNFMFLEFEATDVPLEQVDLYFLKRLFTYLLTKKQFKNAQGIVIDKKECCNNSAVKYLKYFKTVINAAIGFGWIIANPFAGFKAKLEKVEQDYLTEDEINILLNKEITNERLSTVKDLFVFQCLTGLAYIDMHNASKANIVVDMDGNKWLSIARQKTTTPCKIPLLPIAEKLIRKYQNHPVCLNTGKLLPVLTNQKYNAYLKELAALCKIDKELTTHVGRRSFASLALNNGVPAETIIKIIGHSNFNTLHLYAKHDDKKISHDINSLKIKFA